MDASKTIEKLSSLLEAAYDRQEANAAVALLLQSTAEDVNVFFVKRAESPTDSWSGQMALPGGKRDSKDRDLKETVVREVLEEVNINLLEGCRFLGVLPPQRTKRRPELKILPFVVLLEHKPSIRMNEEEVEQCIWVSLKELVHNEGTVTFSFGARSAYIVGKHVIWGLTYRILREFIYVLTSQ